MVILFIWYYARPRFRDTVDFTGSAWMAWLPYAGCDLYRLGGGGRARHTVVGFSEPSRARSTLYASSVRSSAYYTYYYIIIFILCTSSPRRPLCFTRHSVYAFFFSPLAQTSFECDQKKKKKRCPRKERTSTRAHARITTAVHVHTYIVCVEKEKMAKKKLISNTMPKRTRRPLYITPLAITRFSATESIVCIVLCVCVCDLFFCLKVGMQTSIGDANTAPLPGSSRPLSALCSSAPVAHVHRITSLPTGVVGRRWLRVTLFAQLPPIRTVFGNSSEKLFIFVYWMNRF